MILYITLAVVVVLLSILMALIMRWLPERWDLPFSENTNPAGFYAVWGILCLNLILHYSGIDYIWIRAIYFVLAYPAIHWGFQHPQKKMADTFAGQIEEIRAELEPLKKFHGLGILFK